jgi:hypothetical protein
MRFFQTFIKTQANLLYSIIMRKQMQKNKIYVYLEAALDHIIVTLLAGPPDQLVNLNN